MANLTGPERARFVQGMLARIAHRYDLMNRTMTAGQDVRWRSEVIRRAELPSHGRLLDLGAGSWRNQVAMREPAERCTSFCEICRVYPEKEAVGEAARCLRCRWTIDKAPKAPRTPNLRVPNLP